MGVSERDLGRELSIISEDGSQTEITVILYITEIGEEKD
jgi:hypothetical protein